MMKILLLNPHVDALQDIIKTLQKRGVALLISSDPMEAWQVLQLHNTSVELVIVHRELAGPGGEGGLGFISKVKKDLAQADLPMILTSERWSDAEFVRHQKTPQGVNAYLKYPFTQAELFQLIEAVVGLAAEEQNSEFELKNNSKSEEVSRPALVLEDASPIFNLPESSHRNQNNSIQLDAPELNPDEISAIFLKKPTEAPSELLAPDLLSVPVPDLTNVLDPIAVPPQEFPLSFAHPQGDAVVPGGAVHSPDLETLKKYLMLREQDVAALSGQLRNAKERIATLEDHLKKEQIKSDELQCQVDEQKCTIDEFDKKRSIEMEGLQAENSDLKFQMKAKMDKAKLLESKMRELAEDTDRLKERVRTDIRKIRVREKELENRLEIMKKDSEALISARENKIVELKRKVDLLEFNMDLLQEQNAKQKEIAKELKDRVIKATQVMRVASRVLEGVQVESEDDMPKELGNNNAGEEAEKVAS